VTGLGVGSTQVRATSEGITGTAPLTVTIIPVSSLSVLPPSVSLIVGQTLPLTVSLLDAQNNPLSAVGRTITWASSDRNVAMVSTNGVVTAIAGGTATITASTPAGSGSVAGNATVTVTLPVSSIGVSLSASSIPERLTSQATAELRDASGNVITGRTVVWSSSDPTVATVDQTGRVTGMRPGTATINATCEGRTGIAPLTVTPTPVSSIRLTPASMSLVSGGTSSFSASLFDAQGNQLSFSGRQVSWSSTNVSVATVDGAGAVTAIGAGTTSIIVATPGGAGSVADTSTLTVTLVPVARVDVTPAKDTVPVGGQITLTAQPYSASNVPLTGRAVQWASTNVAIATISQKGVVTGVTAGVDTITATVDGVIGRSQVVVVLAPVASVRMTPDTGTLTVGQALTAVATTYDSLGNVLLGRVITWTSANPAKATVSATGLVTAIDSGVVLVRATSEGKVATGTFTLRLVPVAAVTLTVSGGGILLPGRTRTVTVTVTDANFKPLSGRLVSWAVSNTGVGTITPDKNPSSTDSNGRATATFLATFFGQTTVSATADGKTGSVVITVP
jgi:uncharacterized protein YjdB